MNHAAIYAVWTLTLIAGGCNSFMPGTSRSMGDVSYESAFAEGQHVFGQYNFLIAGADPDTGEIRSHPKSDSARPDRLLTNSPARKIATLSLRRDDGQVVATLSVAIERLGSQEAMTIEASRENYSSVPDQTPAEIDAATTAEQNEVWTVDSYDHPLEQRMLDDLWQRLHPESAQPQ